MGDNESPTTSDVRKDRLLELEELIEKTGLDDPLFENYLAEYTELIYYEVSGQGYGNAAEITQSIVNDEIISKGATIEVRFRLESLVRDQVESLAKGVAHTVESQDFLKRSLAVAEPVMAFNGQFIHSITDFTINGAGIDFQFRRTYMNQISYNGPLGSNWDHDYNLWLRVSDEKIYRSTGTLREDVYIRHPKFGQDGFNYWIPPDGQDGIIIENGGSFNYRTPDGVQYFYELQLDFLPFIYRIVRILDKHGNYIEFTYQNDRLHLARVNHPQRIVLFTYDQPGRLTAITDHEDRHWFYDYDDYGDLVQVTTPSTDRYSDGLTEGYEYSSSQFAGKLQHNIVRIVNPDGHITLENEYGIDTRRLSFNRVLRQRQGNGERYFEYEDIVEEFESEYNDDSKPSHQTTVVERNGHPIHYIFNKYGKLLFMEENVLQNGIVRHLVWRYRYNRDGRLVAILSPEGILTQYLFGREYFARRHAVAEDEILGHDDLTLTERQGFGRLLAVVHRGEPFNIVDLAPEHIWNNFFPDIFMASPEDSIIKFSYEQKYGQILTVSDPRHTRSADPENPESLEHERMITRFEYRGPTADPSLLLDRIVWPTPILPDGTVADPIIDRFSEYDDRGRLKQKTDPRGVVTNYFYYEPGDGIVEGYLRRVVVDSTGLAITSEYTSDELGRLTSIKSPQTIGAPEDHFITTIRYNEHDQIIEVTSPSPFNFKVRSFYDKNGNLERDERDVKDENGFDVENSPEVRTYRYDIESRLIESTVGGAQLSSHLKILFRYDCAGNKILTVLPRGNRIRIFYNELNMPVAQIIGFNSEHSAKTSIEYDDDGHLTQIVSAKGNRSSFSYDPFGRIISAENALGNIVRRSYDKRGNLTVQRIFERLGDNSYVLVSRKEFGYDEMARLIHTGVNRFDVPLNAADVENGFVESPGPGELLVGIIFHDTARRSVKLLDPLSREYQVEYDTLHRIAKETDALGNEIISHYDSHNNLVRRDSRDLVRDPVSSTVVAERFFSSAATYDELDRLITSTDSLGNHTQYRYDSRGRLVHFVDSLGNTRKFRIDIYGRMVTETYEQTDTGLGSGNQLEPAQINFEYDLNGNLLSVKDALGRKTMQKFDSLDRHTEIINPDGATTTFLYDADGNIEKIIDNNGLQRMFTVDALGHITRIDVDRLTLDPSIAVEGANFELFKYDALGRRFHEENEFASSAITFSSLGLPLRETIQYLSPESSLDHPLEVLRTFNPMGSLSQIVYPDGRTLRYDYDDLDRLTQIENRTKGQAYPGDPTTPDVFEMASFEYAGRQCIKSSHGNGTSTRYDHDGGGRIIRIAHLSGPDPLLSLQYLYDALGNMRLRNDISPISSKGQKFGYDSLYRLVKSQDVTDRPPIDMTVFAPASTLSVGPIENRQSEIDSEIGELDPPHESKIYEYDLVGNRRLEILPTTRNITYSPNNLDQYASRNGSNYRYCKNGNLISDGQYDYRYDSQNRLVNVIDRTNGNSIIRFLHDASGRRIMELRNNEAIHLVYNGPMLIAEYRGDALFAEYTNGIGLDRPLHIAAESQEYWYHSDLVGSTRILTDRTGADRIKYTYDPFGSFHTDSIDIPYNPLLFAGRRLDKQLGSYDFRSRQYNPVMGRFSQRDPLGMVNGTNLYAYVGNNPLIFSDPFGTEPKDASSGSSQQGGELNLGRALRTVRDFMRAASQPRDFLSGQVLKGPYNLWSGATKDGLPGEAKARAAPGYLMEDTPHHWKALEMLDDYPGHPKATFEEAWHPTSRATAVEAVRSDTPIASHGLDTHPRPDKTVQATIEIPAIQNSALLPAGLMKAVGLFDIYNASQVDNPWVKVIGILGGTSEVIGGTLFLGGAVGLDPSFMTAGSKFFRYGGGGSAVVSLYGLYLDYKRGDVLSGIGNASNSVAGILGFFGFTAAASVAGAFAFGYGMGRLVENNTDITNDLSDRGVRVQYFWGERGAPNWFSLQAGAAASLPVVGIGVELSSHYLYSKIPLPLQMTYFRGGGSELWIGLGEVW